MAKIPIKPVANFAIKNGPLVAKIIIDNQHNLKNGFDKLSNFAESQQRRKEQKAAERTVPYLEQLYKKYNKEILPNLDTCQRNDLIGYKIEVQKQLNQISTEKQNDAKPKAVLHNKKSKKWEQVLSQVEGKLNAKDYEEYLKLYHNPNTESAYFKGYKQNTAIFKKLLAENDSDKIRVYLSNQTKMDLQDINRDFCLDFSE